MHAGSPKWESPVSSDLNKCATNTASSSSVKGNISRTSSILDRHTVEIPGELQRYTTTTSRPSEIYSKLHESREKRLRLLLRRFTNQIQYGCKNPYCAVPTCLSYRKRHATVPVRPYADVTARALAWRCVEDYAENTGKAPSEGRHASSVGHKPKGKVTPCERGQGLCWNEPVVPWYADAKEYIRRCSQTQRKHHAATEPETVASERQKSFSHAQVSTYTSSGASGDSVVPDAEQDGRVAKVTKRDTSRETHVEDMQRNPQTEGVNKADRGVRFEEPGMVSEHLIKPSKDTASFSQMLYDTTSIKSFERLTQAKANLDVKAVSAPTPELAINERSSGNSTAEKVQHQAEAPMSSDNPVHTFKILNKKVIGWLVNFVTRRPDSMVYIKQNEDTHMSVANLARQSLHFCLSHPLRLLKSAEAWRLDSDSEQDQTTEQDPTSEQADLSRSDHRQDPTRTGTEDLPLLPSWNDAELAFDALACIQPHHETLGNVFTALQHAYIPPAALSKRRVIDSHDSAQDMESSEHDLIKRYAADPPVFSSAHSAYVDDHHVASLCMISLLALINSSDKFCNKLECPIDKMTMVSHEASYLSCRESGHAFPQAYMAGAIDRKNGPQWRDAYQTILTRIDVNDNMYFLRLLESIADVISHRIAVQNALKMVKEETIRSRRNPGVVELVVDQICRSEGLHVPAVVLTAHSVLDYMCIILLKRWDRKSTIKKTSSVGGALQMLAGLYRNRMKLDIPAVSFALKFVAESLDATRMPLEWLAFREDTKHIHILAFSFLFEPNTLVKYFRAINIEIMRKSYEYASINYAYASHFLQHKYIPVFGAKEVVADLRPHMARYFVLTVRRQHMLEDAVNQIWRRQHQELMRPLKVSLGKGEGEDGLDHGGVQQEFFRMIFAEALNIEYGMFTIDDRTLMTWFQPGSLEPLYKFEALGILMSLAVYNSVTLPITFPLAFYRKLLGLKVKQLEHIEDGWPDLAKGLRALQDWSDGDVGDVIARTYEFSYRVFDTNHNVDMSRIRRQDMWPTTGQRKSKDKIKTAKFESLCSSPMKVTETSEDPSNVAAVAIEHTTGTSLLNSNGNNSRTGEVSSTTSPTSEAPLVTNANRDCYIKDYIFWLTNKSIAPQFDAFLKGFQTCLDTTALSIFTPEALKKVVEGYTEIDIDGLQASATYDEFAITDQIITDFWDIVRDMSPTQHKKLLEFVTASDRVPVNGISSITFIIQRNGDGDDRLPSSSTCYGRLLLPKYSSKEIMRAKLEKAIENSVGFGSL